jgi:hypothetical protein
VYTGAVSSTLLIGFTANLSASLPPTAPMGFVVDLNAFARSREGEPPGEPSAIAGSTEASPSPNPDTD